MKKFLAIYLGSGEALAAWRSMDEATKKEREAEGMKGWMAWGKTYEKSIVDMGAPLGKTKQIDPNGITDTKNNMGAYTIVEAESHEEAARLFVNHPHFTLFPGASVEVMECLPLPSMV